jgi:hypothetical protein
MGLKLSASIFTWTQGKHTITEQGFLVLGDKGVHASLLAPGTVFAYEATYFIIYGIIALMATSVIVTVWMFFFAHIFSESMGMYTSSAISKITTWEIICLIVVATTYSYRSAYPSNDLALGPLCLFCYVFSTFNCCFAQLLMFKEPDSNDLSTWYFTIDSLISIFRLTTILYCMVTSSNFSLADIRILYAILLYLSAVVQPSVGATLTKKEVIDSFIGIASGAIGTAALFTNPISYASAVMHMIAGCSILVDRSVNGYSTAFSQQLPLPCSIIGFALSLTLVAQNYDTFILSLIQHIFVADSSSGVIFSFITSSSLDKNMIKTFTEGTVKGKLRDEVWNKLRNININTRGREEVKKHPDRDPEPEVNLENMA